MNETCKILRVLFKIIINQQHVSTKCNISNQTLKILLILGEDFATANAYGSLSMYH